MISNDGSLDKEIASRISKASQALGRLRNGLLNHHNATLDTKLKVYRAVVLSSLLLKQLERFYQCALRSILGIRWQDMVTNTEVFERTNWSPSKRCCWRPASVDRPCDQDGGSPYSKATSVWRPRAGSLCCSTASNLHRWCRAESRR